VVGKSKPLNRQQNQQAPLVDSNQELAKELRELLIINIAEFHWPTLTEG